jgi:hypothetical protein
MVSVRLWDLFFFVLLSISSFVLLNPANHSDGFDVSLSVIRCSCCIYLSKIEITICFIEGLVITASIISFGLDEFLTVFTLCIAAGAPLHLKHQFLHK